MFLAAGACPAGSVRLEKDEPALLRAIRAGDPAAFHELVDRYGGQLMTAACGMVGNRADAEDVVQETFAGAFKSASSFRGEASLKTWLLRILMRQAARHHRKGRNKRMFSLSGSSESDEDMTANTGPTVRSGAAAVESRLDVTSMLAVLSPEHREVLVLRELQGLSYDEMATAIGVPQGTIESRLFRARRELKTRFAAAFEVKTDEEQ